MAMSQVQYPPFLLRNTNNFEVKGVEISDNHTVVYLVANSNFITVPENSYIMYDNNSKTLKLLSSDGITIGGRKNFTGSREFILYFEQLPYNVEIIDLHLGEMIVWGIEFNSEKLSNPTIIPKDFFDISTKEMIFDSKFSSGYAVLKGTVIELSKPEMKISIGVRCHDIFTNASILTGTNVESGKFELKIPLSTLSEQVELLIIINESETGLSNRYIMLSQGKESSVFIDLPELFRAMSKVRIDKNPDANYLYFKGEFAELNNYSNRIYLYKAAMKNQIKRSNNLQISDILDIINQTKDKFYTSDTKMPDYMKDIVHYEFLLSGSENLFKFEINDYSFLNDYKLNKPFLISLIEYKTFIQNACNLKLKSLGYPPYLQYWKDNNLIEEEDKKWVDTLISYTYANAEEKQAIARFFQKYSDTSLKLGPLKFIASANVLSGILDKGQFVDLLKIFSMCYKMISYFPLMEFEVKQLDKLSNPELKNIIKERNESIKKSPKTGIFADKPFEDVLKVNTGKVIVVDFWGLWCAPCREAIRTIEPAKSELKDVIFIYVCDKHIEGQWRQIYPHITGLHYRLQEDELRVLEKKYNVEGRPHYMIIGKDGEIKF
jgi:thiol-disulfide isomerase/thioredoxin